MITKTKISANIDTRTLDEFKRAAKEDSLNISLWVQNHMEKYLSERRDRYEKSS